MTMRYWVRQLFAPRKTRPIRKVPARPPLRLETLEDRLAPAVSASLTGSQLAVFLSAANDRALIAPSGSNISVIGTGFSAQAFTGVTSIVVSGANTSSQDAPNQVVTFGDPTSTGGGGTISLSSATGTDALKVSGVTSVLFSNLTIDATSGSIDVNASETAWVSSARTSSSPQVAVGVTGATLRADDIRLDATASSTSTYSAPLGGVLDALGVAAATADLEPSATVTVTGSSTKVLANGAGGTVAIDANVVATVNTVVTVGTDIHGNSLNPTDAAIAESTVNSTAIARVGGGSTVSAGTGTLSITSTNTTTVTTEVDGTSALGGATGAVTLDNSTSNAFVDGGSTVTGGTVNVLATTTNTANTVAKSTATGGGANPTILKILAGADKGTSKAGTASAPVTVSGAVAVTKFTPTTQAYVDSSTVAAGIAINIAASSDNNTATEAKAPAPTRNTTFNAAAVDPTGYLIGLPGNGYTTGQPVVYHANGGSAVGLTDGKAYYVIVNPSDPNQISLAASRADATAPPPVAIQLSNVTGAADTLSPPAPLAYFNPVTQASEFSVGVAVAIGDTVASNTAMLESTTGATSLSAPTILVQATTPTASASDVHDISAKADSGVSAANVGAAGALALNIVSNTSEAKVLAGSTVTTVGDVTFAAQNLVSETASAKADEAVGDGAGSTGGVGASVALQIASNTTRVELEDGAQLTGVHNLTFTADSTDLVSTTSGAGSGGGAVSISPSAAITVVTNTTVAQVGAPDAANDRLVIGGAFSAKATHTALASTVTGAASDSGDAVSAGVAIAIALVTDQTTATTLRSLDAQGAVAFEADGSAASIVSSNATASGGPTKSAESTAPSSGPAPSSQAAPGSNTADSNSVDGQNAQQRDYADKQSTIADSKGKSVSAGNTKKKKATPAAKTSDGSVTVAAAVAVNIVDSQADATIAAGLTINAGGPLSLTANNDTGDLANPIFAALAGSPGDTANAWGIAAGTSKVGVGAAVALNLVNASAVAEIQSSSSQPTTINAHGVTVDAGMLATSPMNAFGATATSGAGAGDVGVAGSVAINIVDDSSLALIDTGTSVAANGGDVSVNSLNNSTDSTFALPGGNAAATSVGIGASLALNIISDTTRSEIEDGAALNNAGKVTVLASSTQTILTWGQNGAAGGIGIGAGIAIAVADDQTTARIGADPQTLNATGDITIGASGSFAVNSLADATTTPGATLGVGASVVVNTTQDAFLAELGRNATTGAVGVTSTGTASSQAVAIASEKGADPKATDSSTGSNGTADKETQNQSSYAHDQGSSNSNSASSKVAAPPKSNDKLTSPLSKAKGKSGGSNGATKVGVAAAVAVNVLTTSTVAEIDNGLTVNAGGALTVGTANQSSALALADGRATKNIDSFGAAVSLNVADVTNTATIGAADIITANGVAVTALMGAGPNDFSTQGLGVAIGTQAGVAGSAGINVITITTRASIGAGSVVDSIGGLNVQAANDETFQDIAFTAASGKTVGAGAAIDVNVLNNSTNAFLDSNVQANVADMTQVTSESSLNPSQDPVPNSPADILIATGTLDPATGEVTAINGTIVNVIGRDTNAPFKGEPVTVTGKDSVTGNASSYVTAIQKTDSKPFAAKLTFGSAVITSKDLIFRPSLLDPFKLKMPKIGETVGGPGIPNGATIVGLTRWNPATGVAITLSVPVFATGSAPLAASTLRLVNLTPAPISGPVILTETPVDLVSKAISSLHPTNFAAGAAGSSNGGAVAGSFIVNVIDQTTHASINSGAAVNTRIGTPGYPAAHADQGVTVSATETTTIMDWAGAIAGGSDVGIGAALDVNIVTEDGQAFIASSATVLAAHNVVVEASTHGDFQSITAAAGFSEKVAIAGAASVEILSATTNATIGQGATVAAQGDVLVQAARQAGISTTAGQLAVSGVASIGAAVSTVVDTVNTGASVGANAHITAHGTSGTLPVLVGDAPTHTTPFSGVAVVAATFQNLHSIVLGGAASAGGDAVATVSGSIAANIANDTTLAHLDAGATIDATNNLPGTGPGIMVTAADRLTLLSAAGALAVTVSASPNVGVGVGADIDSITKNTQAYIAATGVTADGDVLVRSESSENLTSITVSLAVSLNLDPDTLFISGAISGALGVYVLNLTTLAYIGNAAAVHAGGSILVAASETNSLDLLSGSIDASLATVGAAATVPVITKTTEAYIGTGAHVDALGLGDAIQAENGQFAISYQNYGSSPGVVHPKPESANLTGNGNSLTSPRLGQQRVATPVTTAIHGLAVTAVNADSLQGVGVDGSAGAVSLGVSGSVGLITNHTAALIDSGAAINSDDAGAAGDQSVLVADGNDTSFLGIAAAAAIGINAAIAPGVVVLVVNNTTTASIADGASVAARGDVAAVAHSSGDVLTIAAGVAAGGDFSVGGSISYVGFNDTTQANIGAAATTPGAGTLVNAGGNVLVDATDDTEAYMITGSISVAVEGAAVGGSVSIVNLNKNTAAFIGSNATVNALANTAPLSGIFDGNYTSGGDFETLAGFHGVAVQAATSENVTNVAAAGAVGQYAGLAGGVSVELFHSNTRAYVGNDARINADSAGANASQSVDVAAVNRATSFSFAGGIAAGDVGISGAVDVGILQNSTQAYIGDRADIHARKDVNVYALANDSVQTYALGAAVGLLGAVGSVSVWSIGVPYSAGYTDGNARDGTVSVVTTGGITRTSSGAEGETATGSSLVGLLNTPKIAANTNATTPPPQYIIGDPVSQAIATAVPSGTVAFIGPGVSVSAGNDVNVRARSEVSYNGIVGGLAAGAVGIGGSVEIANIQGSTRAYIDANSTIGAGGTVAVDADLVKDTSNGVAFAGTAGIVAIGAQVVDIQDRSTESATLNGGVRITQARQVAVTAEFSRSLTALAAGGDVALGPGLGFAAGVGVAIADASGGASAGIGASAQIGLGGAVGGVTVAASSADSVTAKSYGVSAGLEGAATGVFADAESTPSVSASVGDNAVIASSGAVDVTAQDTPFVNARALGVAVAGGVGLGAAVSQAHAGGTTSSTLGNGVGVVAGSLLVKAERSPVAGKPTAQASSTAGVGGILAGINATVSTAASDGDVLATTGAVSLVVGGDITIDATNTSDQSASALGVAAGAFALGIDVSTSTSDVHTQARLLAGAQKVYAAGTIAVTAIGTDENDAASTAGSGGVIAGNAAIGNTNDASTVAAEVGGSLTAGTVNVSAVNNSVFMTQVDSVNAALVGASGAVANNNATIAADATVDANATILASSAVNIAARNGFTEKLPDSGSSVSAGAGGVYSGAAAASSTTLAGNADVTIGGGVAIDVEVPNAPHSGNPGIFLTASSILDTSDRVTLSSGGVIAGAGTDSSLHATLNNNVTTNSTAAAHDDFTTNQSIGIGTHSEVNASNTSEAHTWGLGAAADSTATTAVTANDTVALGPDTNLTAFQNISLTAGNDPTAGGRPTTLAGSSDAQSFVRGLVAIPAASATTALASNATLTVGANDLIYSGANITLAAAPGTPAATAVGVGHGYELGFIPVTDGSSSPTATTTSTVTLNGTITAGIFDRLEVTIPAGDPTHPVFSEPDSPIPVASPAYAFTSNFDPASAINNSSLAATEKLLLVGTVSSTPVNALLLGSASAPLTANGGNVTVNAGKLLGTATITAYGAPTIDITNNSSDYLVLGPIVIPDLAAGNVLFTGKATAAPGGMQVLPTNAGGIATVNIQELYDLPVGTSSSGPAVFVTGEVSNLGGLVSIYNAFGSVIQASPIDANQVNITAPNGALVVNLPNGTEVTGSSPYSAFSSSMIWPGGNPATTVNLSADIAVAYVANAILNADGRYGTDSTNAAANAAFTAALIGKVGQTPPRSFLSADGNDSYEPSTPTIGDGSRTPPAGDNPFDNLAGQSLIFLGANSGENNPSIQGAHGITQAIASSESPVHASYQMNRDNQGYFPVVPVEPLGVTVNAFPSSPPPGSGSSAINAGKVIIKAKVIDLDSTVRVGLPNNWSVTLPSSLTALINQYRIRGGSTLYDLPLSTVSSGDRQITAQYDAANDRIIVQNVNASSGAGFLQLDGEIVNTTNQAGNIQVNDGNGQVTIDNQTGVTVVVNNVNAGIGTSNSARPSMVDIIDTRKPAGAQQTLYVYDSGAGIHTYQGDAGLSVADLQSASHLVSATSATSTSYSPLAGLRYEWQLQAVLDRTVQSYSEPSFSNLPAYTSTPWAFENPNDPWSFLASANGGPSGTPAGWTVVDPELENAAFREQVGGAVTNWYFSPYIYHNGHFDFAPTNPLVRNSGGNEDDPWAYYMATQVALILTDSVKADNPISINFFGSARGSVAITSDAPVVLAGTIANPDGDTTVNAPSITQQDSSETITSNNLTLTATAGGVGTSALPIDASLTPNGVLKVTSVGSVYLTLGSGALLGNVQTYLGGGDVVINATCSLESAPGLTSILGNNITLTSATGHIGTPATAVTLFAEGVVNVAALGDINLVQGKFAGFGGDLKVGRIVSTSGDVSIAVPGGRILNASGTTWAGVVTSAESRQVWQDLSLTNASAAQQQAVTAFQNEVEVDYQAYWQLLGNGSVLGGVFTLSAQGVARYSSQAGQAQNPAIANPTDAQVQAYATGQYQSFVAFFSQNLGPAWTTSAAFQIFDPAFRYQATPQQASDLEANAAWTTPELANALARVALDPAAGNVVGIATPNVSGANVTLVSSQSIGQTGSSPTFISLADLQAGVPLPDATAPADVLEVGTVGTNTVTVPFGQEPAGFTLTGVSVSPNAQLFTSSTGTLKLTATGAIVLQSTAQDVTLGKVAAGGVVNIAAPGSILSDGGAGSGISTPGDLVLKVDTGTVGSPTDRLNVGHVAGTVSVYTPPHNAFLTGVATITSVTHSTAAEGINTGTVTVATFTDNSDISDLSATITWADGLTSAGTVVVAGTPGLYTVAGSHTYAEEINTPANFSVTVKDSDRPPVSKTLATATVSDAPLTLTSVTHPTAYEGIDTGVVAVAAFTDAAGVYSDIRDLSATITWADGSTSAGTVVAAGTPGGYTVTGGHTYAEEINAPVNFTVAIRDAGGSSASKTITATVADAGLTVTSVTHPAAAEGITTGTVTVATFTDAAGTCSDISDLSVTITWADGSTSAGTVMAAGTPGLYAVGGSHTYTEEIKTPVNFTVTVKDSGGSSASKTINTATVADAPLTLTCVTHPTAYEGIDTGVAAVAAFTDAAGVYSNIGDLSATITWADGSTSAGTVVAAGTLGLYAVTGSHTYAEEINTPANFTVVVKDMGGSSTSRTINTATVADAPLTVTSVTHPAATEGVTTGTVTVAAFTDAAGVYSDIRDLSATITWADGSTSAGTVVAAGTPGGYTVTGGHTYAEEINAPADFTVAVKDIGGASASKTITTAKVADAIPVAGPITGSASVIPGQALTLSDAYTDTGTLDTHTGKFVWGDGTSTTVNASEANGSGTVSSTHIYAATGTYTVTLTVADDEGTTAIAVSCTVTVTQSAYLLDPSANGALSVSGNAVINLPGSLVVDSSSPTALIATGKASVTANQIIVVGGDRVSGQASLNPGPILHGTAVADPLAGLNAPGVIGTPVAVNLAGQQSRTIGPGVYSQIQVSGQASLTMQPGVYVIAGGGFSVSGNGSVTGNGVMIYNAGSGYAYNAATRVVSDGGTFGSISLAGNGTINLSAPASGQPYTGVILFQARGNTRGLSLSGNGTAGTKGTIYAPAAPAGLSGNAQLTSSLVVSTLSVTGNAGSFQLAGGANSEYAASTSNWITNGILTVSVQDDTGNGLDPNALARLGDAMSYLNQTLGSYGVDLTWATPGTIADVHLHFASSTPEGGAGDGVMGFTTAANDVYFVTGWNFSTSPNGGGIGANQYDFLTLATHELAHTVGLGESSDSASVMYEYLTAGTVRRTFTDGNLALIDTNADRFMNAAPPQAGGSPNMLLSATDSSLRSAGALPSAFLSEGQSLPSGAMAAVVADLARSFGWALPYSASGDSQQDGLVKRGSWPDGGAIDDLVLGGPWGNRMAGSFGFERNSKDDAERGDPPGGAADQTVMDALFTDPALLAFESAGLDRLGLSPILNDLASLFAKSSNKPSGPTP